MNNLKEINIQETEEKDLVLDMFRADMDDTTITIVIYAKSHEKRLKKLLNLEELDQVNFGGRDILFMTPIQVNETQGGALLTSPNIILFGYKEGSKSFYGLNYKMLWRSVCQYFEGRLLAIK